MAVISKLDLDGNNITKYNNVTISNINFNGTDYHFAEPNNVLDGVCNNAVSEPIIDMQIKGNSIQDGTPTPDTPIEIESVGEKTPNMIDYKKISNRASNGITYTNNNDGTYTANGTLTLTLSSLSFANGIVLSDIKPGIKYYCSCGNDLNNSDRRYYLFAVIKNSSTGSIRYFASYITTKTFTLSEYETVTSLELRINASTGELFSVENEVFKPILCKASEYIDYEPYGYKIPIKVSGEDVEPIITNIYLNEPLRKIGDYADYIDYKNKKVVRNIASYNLNDVSSIKDYTSQIDGFYKAYTINKVAVATFNSSNSKCSHFITERIYLWSVAEKSSLSATQYATYICVPNSIASTSEELLQWLKTQEINVYYTLETPTEEIIDIPTIETFDGTNIFAINTKIEPSKVEINYWKQKGI